MKKKISTVIIILILLLSSVMIVGANYYSTVYANQEFDQILYYLLNGVQGTSSSVTKTIIATNIIPVIILFSIMCIFIVKKAKNKIFLKLKIINKRIRVQIFPIKITSKHRAIYTVFVFIIALIIAIDGFKIDNFIKNSMQETKIYEEYYVDGNSISITFPEQKRNLIFISAESMEATLFSKENGGGWSYSVIPELEKLAMENISFSNTNKLGGAEQLFGNDFTAGALVGQTAGIPLLTPAVMNNSNTYMGNGKYLDNAYTLGDILAKEGYNLEIMMGSDGEFGGRTQYFTTNGNYKIFDVNYAIEAGKMTEDEEVWWGFEDDKLFEWAKEEITELASQDAPFNFIMQTADTHFMDGYLSKNVGNEFATQYENVYAYSSKSIYEFVQWIQAQDFYENTTIVIIGDHLGMQHKFYTDHIEPSYKRTIYNVIINSAIEAKNTENRVFSTMDMYPTILASMGAEIEGERIGLGTNLFSEKQTLIEELGYDYLNDELKKKSTFYNNALLGEDYYLIQRAVEEKKKEEGQE